MLTFQYLFLAPLCGQGRRVEEIPSFSPSEAFQSHLSWTSGEGLKIQSLNAYLLFLGPEPLSLHPLSSTSWLHCLDNNEELSLALSVGCFVHASTQKDSCWSLQSLPTCPKAYFRHLHQTHCTGVHSMVVLFLVKSAHSPWEETEYHRAKGRELGTFLSSAAVSSEPGTLSPTLHSE